MTDGAIRSASTGAFIGNQWVPISDGSTVVVVAPAEGAKLTEIGDSGPIEVDAAVSAARSSLDGSWGRLTATDRGRILARAAHRIRPFLERAGKRFNKVCGGLFAAMGIALPSA